MSEEYQEGSIQPSSFQPAPELSSKKPLDFTSTIARLEMRATSARKRARWAGVLLLFGVYGIVAVLSYNLIGGEKSFKYGELVSFSTDNRQTIESQFARRVTIIMGQLVGPESPHKKEGVTFVPPSKEAAAALKTELKEALTDLERAIQIADIGKRSGSATGSIAPIVSTAVFSIGVVGILILMIQISVMFIRYHLRLGELYDAQSDALRASGGDAALAYALLQHLSPNAIEVGRAPASLYEKAFEAIQAVAGSKRTP